MATAPDSSPTDRIEELLTCGFCRATLEEPRTLGCFHSFCKKCLARYVETKRKEYRKEAQAKHLFNCPQCRTQFELKEGESVDRLPCNYFINNMLDLLPLIQQGQKLPCDSCRVQASVASRCIDCERYLCKNCLKTHSNWPDFESHVLLNLEELAKPENQSKARGKPRCQKVGHSNKQLEFYCNTCTELVCINCVVLDHPKPDHNYEPIDKVADKRREALKTASAVLQKLSDKGQHALQKIERSFRNLQANTKKAKDDILQQEKEILEKITKKLRRNTEVLIGQVDKKQNEINENLVKQRDNVKAYVEKVNGSLMFAKNVINKGSNEDIVSLGKDIYVNASDIEKSTKPMQPVHSGYFKYQHAKTTKSVVDDLNLESLGKICKSFTNALLIFRYKIQYLHSTSPVKLT